MAERPATTRQRAATELHEIIVRYVGWDAGDGMRRQAEELLDAAVPLVLDDIEALIQNRARAPKLAKTESLRLFDLICNAVLDEVLGDVAAWRERNGWSRD